MIHHRPVMTEHLSIRLTTGERDILKTIAARILPLGRMTLGATIRYLIRDWKARNLP